LISSFLISVGAFVLLLSIVVIAHEYGHYKTGRLLGIGVERFSIGFGPALYKWTRDGVEFKIGAVPLGGYVKFVGEEPDKPVSDDQRDKAFSTAPVYKRMLTVVAGPAMNVVLGFVLFCIIFVFGFPAPAAVIGDVAPNTPAAKAGVLPGDRVVAIDGKPIRFWHELSLRVADSAARPLVFAIERAGRRLSLPITPERINAPDMLYMFETQRGSIGVSPMGLRPLIGVRDANSDAAKAGLKTGDVILTVDDKPVVFFAELEPLLAAATGPLRLGVGRGEPNVFQEHPALSETVVVPPAADGPWTLGKLGVESGEMYVYAVQPASPAEAAGLHAGDRLLAVDDRMVNSWKEFTEAIRAKPDRETSIMVLRSGATTTIKAVPRKVEELNALGQKETYGQIGIQRLVAFTPAVEEVERYWNPVKILIRGLQESWTWTVRLIKGLFYLFVGKVPTSSLGGPIAIARMAGESAQMGVIQFLIFTAIISFNLAFINLLPIPIFDGGHLLLFAIEGVRRRPLSERAMGVALRIGIVVLAALFMLIFYNDFRWVFFKLKEMLGA
jgi:regulator of sigma E protease